MSKIYLIDFVEYTNAMRNTVYNPDCKKQYISVPKEGFLVREEHLDFIRVYGKGIRSAKLVGELFEIPRPEYILED